MARKYTYRVGATVNLSTEVEALGSFRNIEDDNRVSDYEEAWASSETVRIDREIAFEFESESRDEGEVNDEVNDLLQDLRFDSDDIEWEIEDFSIDNVEMTSDPDEISSLSEAQEAIEEFLDSHTSDDDRRFRNAVEYVLDHAAAAQRHSLALDDEVRALRGQVGDLTARLDLLQQQLQAAQSTPFGNPILEDSLAQEALDEGRGDENGEQHYA